MCIIPACSSPDLSTDSILDLEAKKGKGDAGHRGEIVLRLSRIDAAKAGNIAIRNGELDIERSGFN